MAEGIEGMSEYVYKTMLPLICYNEDEIIIFQLCKPEIKKG
jgi:hypothetical protein